ncbi:MAG: transporter related [Gammaproteobacteria bacterium]|nr:transporter related [Gammaproteobacteria bacterium]
MLDSIELDIAGGEFVCIVGASGCGKSSLLRLIAGLDTDYSGSITYEGQAVTGPDLSRGIIFQEHRLFPWLTVEQNIQLAFSATDVPRREQTERVQEQIRRVGLVGFETAWPIRFQAAWLSVRPSPALSSTVPNCSCWMSPWARWMP